MGCRVSKRRPTAVVGRRWRKAGGTAGSRRPGASSVNSCLRSWSRASTGTGFSTRARTPVASARGRWFGKPVKMTTGQRILLVDDERSVRESLGKLLRAEGYAVDVAENGQVALEQYRRARPDLLLLDIGLPVRDGWSTLEWLVGVDTLMPVVLITGRFRQDELARQAGADALFEKPLDVPRMLATIHELTERPSEPRARRVRTVGFRYEPCDIERFRDLLLKRSSAPCGAPRARGWPWAA